MSDSSDRIESMRKPEKCPTCGSPKVAQVRYGYPIFGPELEKELAEGKTVLGGCVISGDDPEWQCVDCQQEIYRKRS